MFLRSLFLQTSFAFTSSSFHERNISNVRWVSYFIKCIIKRCIFWSVGYQSSLGQQINRLFSDWEYVSVVAPDFFLICFLDSCCVIDWKVQLVTSAHKLNILNSWQESGRMSGMLHLHWGIPNCSRWQRWDTMSKGSITQLCVVLASAALCRWGVQRVDCARNKTQVMSAAASPGLTLVLVRGLWGALWRHSTFQHSRTFHSSTTYHLLPLLPLYPLFLSLSLYALI